jgi:hypothetical protein
MSYDENAPALPGPFLGRCAPRLQELFLAGIPFSTLPKLLSSTHKLTAHSLEYIPHSGHILPGAMVPALSTVTRLKELSLQFRSPLSLGDNAGRHSPPSTRVVFPALTSLQLKGDNEYLEDFMHRIDTPARECHHNVLHPTSIRQSSTTPLHYSHRNIHHTLSSTLTFFR